MRRSTLYPLLALALAGCASHPDPRLRYAGVPLPVPPVPPGMQYLYGSGEAAGASLQTWRSLVYYVRSKLGTEADDSVVLASGATLAAPAWVPCGTKPKAAVFDVDETVLLNLGFEYDTAANPAPYSEARWQAWEKTGATKVAAVPGARAALGVLRQIGVTIVFNTNRSAANAAETRAAIEGAGLGPAVHGETLFLAGDDAGGTSKDGRRATIAAKYCVIAMGGDQLGDFTDLFNVGLAPAPRRAAALAEPIVTKWGAGWFVLPNPVYGTGLKGGLDDVFPADRRWTPPTPLEK